MHKPGDEVIKVGTVHVDAGGNVVVEVHHGVATKEGKAVFHKQEHVTFRTSTAHAAVLEALKVTESTEDPAPIVEVIRKKFGNAPLYVEPETKPSK